MRIAHASIDENKHTSGGNAGNQSGKEVCIRQWYSKPWTILLRYPDRKTRERIATIAETLASPPVNKLIGYDQNERNSLHVAARASRYNLLDFVNTNVLCETDCSAFVTCVCLFAGINKLEYTDNAPTTATMKSVFKKAGFEVITDSKYVSDIGHLSKGDILLKPNSHTVIVLDDGLLYDKPAKIVYYPKYDGLGNSISDALRAVGEDSSKSTRKKIYNANFTDEYRYTAKQNTAMLILLKQGALIKP